MTDDELEERLRDLGAHWRAQALPLPPLAQRRAAARQWRWVLAVAVCAALGGGGYAVAVNRALLQTADAKVLVDRPVPAGVHPVTLRQAWDLAGAEGRRWTADARVVEVEDVDAGDPIPPAEAGVDGRRAIWRVVFSATSRPARELVVRVDNGRVVSAVEQPLAAPPAATPEPAIDSPQALQQALQARPALGPSASAGYNFVVDSGQLRVVGVVDGQPATVVFDAATGKIAGGQVYAPSGGGVAYSTDAGATWQASNLTGWISDVADVPGRADAAVALQASRDGLRLWRTDDGGRAWTEVGRLPAAAGNHGRGLAWLGPDLVAGGDGLWVSSDGGATWAKAPAGAPTSPYWMCATRGELLVDGASHTVLATADLHAWHKVLDGDYRLYASTDGSAAFAMPDQAGVRTMYVIEGGAARPVTMPVDALRAAGTPAHLVVSDGSIAVSQDGGASWQVVEKGSFASLAVPPDFPTDGVIIAGGFQVWPSYRSADGGQTWQRIHSGPEQAVQGDAEIARVAFLSPRDVVAANPPNMTWQSG